MNLKSRQMFENKYILWRDLNGRAGFEVDGFEGWHGGFEKRTVEGEMRYWTGVLL